MGTCALCEANSEYISQEMSVCLKCIREEPKMALSVAMKAHERSREAFNLPLRPLKESDGAACKICVNECKISEGGTGYCGLRKNEGGKLKGVSSEHGKLSWYYDPLPTNCVGDWICPGGTGTGYPDYAYTPGPEKGYKNLAVFFHACSFNCLYCQNWQFRRETLRDTKVSVDDLISDIDESTSCICYFGGDPSPQVPFAINASKQAMKRNKGRILRICWETNGSMSRFLLDEMIDISLDSGGCIKFDLKAFDETLHRALTGISNRRTLENFARAGERLHERKTPPLLIASTLLVPGYIDDNEVEDIANFIASVNPEIPYSLLGFFPHFFMSDMVLTQKKIAEACLKTAQKAGLTNVRIGNTHLIT